MKRIQEKIKDLVEPQSFEQVGNFADDPARALASYRFTDVTSDLLARWLDQLASLPPGCGEARALAGARGVGKSHALAVFGALVGSERLRVAVEDGHVSTAARRLAGRRYTVVRVERGTRPTLVEELGAALSNVFGGVVQAGGDAAEMLAVAASRAMDETLVVVIDTAFGRAARVARDDGPVLAALASMSRNVSAFLALALDDDIAGADGANVALAGTYQIDYLDPENLFRVAEQFVLRKKPQSREALREIYRSLRTGVPNFNWSESRFASLYPVHPLVADVAAGVRQFVPTFALLPFAAAAAARATARPALSLVLLDEVFDAVEADLRRSPDLRAAFAAYDHLTARCVGQLPVMQRYQARLILKSLFVLSLDCRGATAGELCAALLLSDESSTEDATRQVAETLARLNDAAAPGSFDKDMGAGGDRIYRFHIASLEIDFFASAKQDSAPETARPESAPTPTPAPARPANAQAPAGQPANAQAAPTPAAPARPAPAPPPVERPAAAPPAQEAPQAAAEPRREEKPAPDLPADARRAEELTAWARLLTGRANLSSIAEPAGREEVRGALSWWLNAWRDLCVKGRLESLPAGRLTLRVSAAEGSVEKTYGRAASAVETLLAGKLPLEEGLQRVARAFRNSAERFALATQTLDDLVGFIDIQPRVAQARPYLAAAEPTGLAEVEMARRELLSIAEDPSNFLYAEPRERFERLWREFHARYGEHYAAVHDKTAGAEGVREALRELRRGERWREFEQLARLPLVSTQIWRQAEALMRMATQPPCRLPVRELLDRQAVCACRLRPSRAAEFEALPDELEALVERGLSVYRRTLLMLGGHLAIALDAVARRGADDETARRARSLSSGFAQGRAPERFSRLDVRLIERALRRMAAPPPVRVAAPNGDAGLLTRDELRARFVQWLDELPEQPVLIEIVSKAEMNAP